LFVVFRCDCGRVLYCKDYLKSHKCGTCGKVVNVGNRRILYKTEDIDDAIDYVQGLQDEIYHNTGFITANKIR
jgi:hypothetical protein